MRDAGRLEKRMAPTECTVAVQTTFCALNCGRCARISDFDNDVVSMRFFSKKTVVDYVQKNPGNNHGYVECKNQKLGS